MKTKNKVPKKIYDTNDDTLIKCEATKKFKKQDIIDGKLKHLSILYDDNKIVIPLDLVLPEPVGKYSTINAEGDIVVRRDLPKEKVFHTQNRTILDWHGNEHDVSMDIPYYSFPRMRTQAQLIKVNVSIINETEDEIEIRFVFNLDIVKGADKWESELLFVINLSLELFSEYDLIDSATNLSLLRVVRANWQILPPGEYPFERVRESIERQIKFSRLGEDGFDLKRLDYIESLNPDLYVIGSNEFRGYTVFGFQDKNIYILENSRIGNAIYVIKGDWKELSMKTKKQLILSNNPNVARIVHKSGWEEKIKNYI